MGLADGILRKLPVFRGKQRLARWLLGKRVRESRNVIVHGKRGCVYKLPNISENLAFEIFIDGIYEETTSDFISRQVPRNGWFLDLGANIGAVTIPVIKNRPDINVACVEAAHWIFNILQENLTLNEFHNVKVLNRALYFSDDESLKFYTPEDKFGKGSLSAVFTRDSITVKTIRVDTMLRNLNIERVDLIKIDVEGYESHVFRGASELLSRSDAPDILFEFVDWAESQAEGVKPGDAQRYLKTLGYRIYLFEGNPGAELAEIMEEGACLLYAAKTRPGLSRSSVDTSA